MLSREEPARLDRDRLQELYAELGEGAAENVICRALEEMAVRLAKVERAHRQGDASELRRNARSLAAISDPLGMTLLSRVAADVARCVEAGDPVALAATLARLLRLGERSLLAVWDIRDGPD